VDVYKQEKSKPNLSNVSCVCGDYERLVQSPRLNRGIGLIGAARQLDAENDWGNLRSTRIGRH
jgi:hypothetical protein